MFHITITTKIRYNSGNNAINQKIKHVYLIFPTSYEINNILNLIV